MIVKERPLRGYQPPVGTFSVSCINHRGRGCTIAWPLEEAAPLFAQLKGLRADYPSRLRATAKLLRKYLRRQRERDAQALAVGALSTALAYPHFDFASEFSAAVREYGRAAVSVVFGKKRGLMITVGESAVDDASVLKEATRRGLGPVAISKLGEEEAMQ